MRNHRFLFVLVALLFAAGHGHQVFGQFEVHHHHGCEMHTRGGAPEHEGEEPHEEGLPEEESDHMCAQHTTIAIVSACVTRVVVELHAEDVAETRAETAPEAPVAGIDHPPQLA